MKDIISCLQVMKSAAGYYLGYAYLEPYMIRDEKDGEEFEGLPYSRETEYFAIKEDAQAHLNWVNKE